MPPVTLTGTKPKTKTMTAKQIREAGGLPTGYKKQAEVSYQLSFQNWVTVSMMSSETPGQVPSYFITHGKDTTEITKEDYKNHILASIGE